jgi:hypothetical protein
MSESHVDAGGLRQLRKAQRQADNEMARLAVQHVLSTLRLDPAAASRLLRDMTNNELRDVVDGAEALALHARSHLQSRGLPA